MGGVGGEGEVEEEVGLWAWGWGNEIWDLVLGFWRNVRTVIGFIVCPFVVRHRGVWISSHTSCAAFLVCFGRLFVQLAFVGLID